MLNSSPELISFYSSTTSQLIGAIDNAEKMLIELYDSTTNTDNYNDRYAAAVSANEQIVDGETWEMNERMVNDVWLLLADTRFADVDSNTAYAIQDLASSCPFVEGLAVYRARTLWNSAVVGVITNNHLTY